MRDNRVFLRSIIESFINEGFRNDLKSAGLSDIDIKNMGLLRKLASTIAGEKIFVRGEEKPTMSFTRGRYEDVKKDLEYDVAHPEYYSGEYDPKETLKKFVSAKDNVRVNLHVPSLIGLGTFKKEDSEQVPNRDLVMDVFAHELGHHAEESMPFIKGTSKEEGYRAGQRSYKGALKREGRAWIYANYLKRILKLPKISPILIKDAMGTYKK